jgi:hypothetical protein
MDRALLPPLMVTFVLAILAVAEMAGGPQPVNVSTPTASVRPTILPPARGLDASHDAEKILARPLFTMDRRPANETSGAVASTTPPRLSAIMLSGDDRRVMFDDGGKPLLVRVGGRAGPYVVQSIAPDRILVLAGDGLHTLRPTPIPTGAASESDGDRTIAPNSGLSLLQQLQRGQAPHYAVPPPPTIQSLIARMRAQR